MKRLILRRLGQVLPALFGITVVTFSMVHLVPGDPASALAGQRATPRILASIRHQLGVDQSLLTQYWRFVSGIPRGHLGYSFLLHQTTDALVAARLPTTLFLVIYGVDVLGVKSNRLHRMPANGIRMVFQNPLTALNPVMTVGDQCVEAVRARRHVGRVTALARSVEILERMGINDAVGRMKDYPYQFSGGQRQRIVVAIALLGDPAVLLADEPTSALDVSSQASLLELIKEICAERQTAVLFVSHNYAVISQLCERVLVLYSGQMLELGPTQAMFSRSRHPYTSALIASLPSIEHRVARLKAIPGQPPRVGEAPTGCPFLPRCPHADDDCQSAPISLHEITPGHSTACRKATSIWPPA